MKKCFILFLLFLGTLAALTQEATQRQGVMQNQDELMEKMPEIVHLVNKSETPAQNPDDKAKY